MAKIKVLWSLTAMLVFALAFSVSWAADEEAKEKLTIKDVMEQAHKKVGDGILFKTVASGKGTPEDAKKLLTLYEALAADKPPKGTEKDWKTRTEALVAATKAVIDGKPNAGEALTKAANCAACHKDHK